MRTGLLKGVTIIVALATVVANVYISYVFSDFLFLHAFYRGDLDLDGVSPADGLLFLGLWFLTAMLGWFALLLFWPAVYRRIPKSPDSN